jgi:hypothetical protein
VKYHPEHHCINYSAIFRLLSFQFTLSRGHLKRAINSANFSGRHFPSVGLFEETSNRAVFQSSDDFSGRHFPSVYVFEETSSKAVFSVFSRLFREAFSFNLLF